ncbi:MAG: hypothetical protein A4E64_01926 [Syntrophorhabdus sp. PtaU1.Bin058]|nr:MAG: hypothetical protein A4E64_01926 [Syntrophorhabdus sp. PtaU1.Bin058]
MKYLFVILICLFSFSYSYADEQFVICRMGEKDQAAWNMFRKYFSAKGYSMSYYDGADNLDKHIENVNRINRSNGTVFLAIDLVMGGTGSVLVAVTNAKRGKGVIPNIDEVPAIHINNSMELATMVAAPFNKKIKKMPLFMLLGVDMPGIFLRLESPKDKMGEMFDRLHEGLQKYVKRGVQ